MGGRSWRLLLLHLHVAMAQRESDCEGRGFSQSECLAQPNEMCNWDGGECWFYGSEGDDELDDGSEGDDELDDGNFGLPKAWGLIGGAFGAIFSVVGLMAIWASSKTKQLYQTLIKQGVDTEAVVQGKETWTEWRQKSHSGSGIGAGSGPSNPHSHNDGGWETSYALSIIFDADRSTDGVKCRVTQPKVLCSPALYERTKPPSPEPPGPPPYVVRVPATAGQKVTVKYMPSEPRSFMIMEDDNPSVLAAVYIGITCFGSVFALIGAGVGIGMPVAAGAYLGMAAYAGVCVFLLGCCTQSYKKWVVPFKYSGIELQENPTGSIPEPGTVVQGAAAPEQATMART